MKATIRDWRVNCGPMKMQKTSPANNTPASRPPESVASRSKRAMPRWRDQSQTSTAPPVERPAACQSPGISGIAAFAATWFRPQRKQQETSEPTAMASSWFLRSVIAADGTRPATKGFDEGSHRCACDEAAGVCEGRDGDVPADRMAQRLVPRRFDPDLDREAGEKADADKPSRPAGGDVQVDGHRGNAGMQDAREAAVVKQIGPQQQTELGQRPGDEPCGDGAPRHARDHAERGDERAAREVGLEVQGAVVHPDGRPAAPGLARRERR